MTEDDIRYALNKQIDRITSIQTSYGELPLYDDDISAVSELLRTRYQAKLEGSDHE